MSFKKKKKNHGLCCKDFYHFMGPPVNQEDFNGAGVKKISAFHPSKTIIAGTALSNNIFPL